MSTTPAKSPRLPTRHVPKVRKGFRRFQRGQALPLGIAAIMVGMVGAFVLFNTGQVAVNKQRLSDAADSAAYSGMVWQARALNFQAYTNRAMIANEVTVGQAVSLNSWSTYARDTSANLEAVLRPIPFINVVATTIASTFRAVKAVVDPLTNVMSAALEGINTVIEASQTSMFASAFLATPDIVHQVAKASDDSFDDISGYSVVGAIDNLTDWNSFTEKYERNNIDAMRERTDLISQSRDVFATDRRWHFFENIWFFYATPFIKYRVYYDGQTRLLMSNDSQGEPNWEWVAKDAVSLHIKTYRFSWRRGLRSRVNQLPIGWASAYANSDGSSTPKTIDARNEGCQEYTTYEADSCEFLDKNEDAEAYSNTGRPSPVTPHISGEPSQVRNFTGVNAFRSLSQSVLAGDVGDDDPVLRLRTEISMDMDESQSSNDWVLEGGDFSTELASAGSKMSSISVAEVYYRHPKARTTSNDDIAMQRANGYNPYWDVRLAPVEMKERLVALALREDLVGGGTGSSTPGARQLATYGGSEDDLDFDLGGNVSELGSYIGTLAANMGLDEAAGGIVQGRVRELEAAYGSIGEGFGVNALLSLQADFVLDDLRTQLEEELKEALGSAMEQLLYDGITALLEQYGISEEQAREHLDTAEEVFDYAANVEARMEAIVDEVAAELEAALDDLVPEFEEELEIIRAAIAEKEAQIAFLESQVNDALADVEAIQASIEGIENEIEGLGDQIEVFADELKERLTDVVVSSMRRLAADLISDTVVGEVLEYLEADIVDIIDSYLILTPEERLETETDFSFSLEEQEERQDDEDRLIDEYDEGDYARFEE